jgi:hypothetical protein
VFFLIISEVEYDHSYVEHCLWGLYLDGFLKCHSDPHSHSLFIPSIKYIDTEHVRSLCENSSSVLGKCVLGVVVVPADKWEVTDIINANTNASGIDYQLGTSCFVKVKKVKLSL